VRVDAIGLVTRTVEGGRVGSKKVERVDGQWAGYLEGKEGVGGRGRGLQCQVVTVKNEPRNRGTGTVAVA
jgi:hypothetical protein